MNSINKVAVLGAGVMGGGIAAQIANAGVSVVLLDIVLADKEDRNFLANQSIKTQLKAGGYMHASAAGLVQAGNLEDDLNLIADADLIIEVVTEQLAIKRALYDRVDQVRKKGSIVASNTSTIPLAKLTEKQSEVFKREFVVTHFFNPPRHMRLLELVADERTDSKIIESIKYFCDVRLGKTIVDCKDTPGFIANRIGIFWLQTALHEAIDLGVSVEEADALIGKSFGIPSTGVFGLFDLIGLDTMKKVAESLTDTLPEDDPFHAVASMPVGVEKMISDGATGRKNGAGFYRVTRDGSKKIVEVKDFAKYEYRSAEKVELDSAKNAMSASARELLSYNDRGGEYTWRVMGKTLTYAASLAEEIADDITAIDTAMKLGYAWKFGPFELLDRIGTGWFQEKLSIEGSVPDLIDKASDRGFYYIEANKCFAMSFSGNYNAIKTPGEILSLSNIKASTTAIIEDETASLWNLGDGVTCLEFHTKGNALSEELLLMIQRSLEIVESDYKALVIYNDGRQFCSGANLSFFLEAINQESFFAIEQNIQDGQDIYKTLNSAPFPVVGAPAGLALGGGCELLLHCDYIQAYSETFMGLVEQSVGLVPGWGGCKELLIREAKKAQSKEIDIDIAENVFDVLAVAGISSSALSAKYELALGENFSVTMNRDRLLTDAKIIALKLSEDYQTDSQETPLEVHGQAINEYLQAKIADDLRMGKITQYDSVLQKALVKIVSANGQDKQVNEQDLFDLERQVFDQLVRESGTHARIEHMLTHRKPLKN